MSLTATLLATVAATTPAPPTATPPSAVPMPTLAPKVVHCKYKGFERLVRKVYRKDKVTEKDHERIFKARKCLKDPKKAIAFQREEGRKRAARKETARLTPYAGPNGTRWAIPWYIVNCESRGLWTAYNSSSAAGPYQLMGMHGRPFPVGSTADRLQHHRIAAKLWAGGRGASHWVCA